MFSFLIESFIDAEHHIRWALSYIFNGIYMKEIFETQIEAQQSVTEIFQALLEG